jgi:AraC-like DNA-binding protein
LGKAGVAKFGTQLLSQECDVKVRFCPPPPELRRYFTTFYWVEWSVAGGGMITDYLMPEWANLRFYPDKIPEAVTLSGSRVAGTAFPVTGPSSQAVRFSMSSSRMWGVGLLPLGWEKFVGVPAREFADCLTDGFAHPAFAHFHQLAKSLFGEQSDPDAELERITRFFQVLADGPVPDEQRIMAIHEALVDPNIATVAQMVKRAGIAQRTVERICARAFGFPPKRLLRRQRFMRSLSQFMLDPSLKWIGAMDGHYHDQAQFVRDFRMFMGMTPSQYAAMPKPLLGAVMRERARMVGEPVQTLHSPGGGVWPG